MPVHPTNPEQEYFALEEIRKLKEDRLETARKTAKAERERQKELHWMRCPKCGMELAEVDFHGVMVDTCFSCEGMFFDRGEVEKMTQRKEPGLAQRMIDTLFKGGFKTS